MKTLLHNLDDMVGKTVQEIGLDCGSSLSIVFTDESAIILRPTPGYGHEDLDIDLVTDTWHMDANDLVELHLITPEEYDEIDAAKRKQRAEHDKAQLIRNVKEAAQKLGPDLLRSIIDKNQ